MLARVRAYAAGLLRRRTISAEVDEELAFHLEQETARLVARGVSPPEAARLAAAALRAGVTRDDVADVRTTWIETAWREVRLGARTLAGAPTFTLPAILVLGLGLGGTTAVMSVLDGVLLRALPFPDPDALVRVWSRNDDRRIPFLSVSRADFDDWRARSAASLELGAYERPRVVRPREHASDPFTLVAVSPSLFSVLGIGPAAGRVFDEEDESGSLVVSHDAWHRRFASDPDLIGRTIVLEDQAHTVVGIMPPGFEIPTARADLWAPLPRLTSPDSRSARILRVLARQRADGDISAVRRELEAIAAQLDNERAGQVRGWSVTVLPLFDTVVSPEFRRSLWITAGAVLCVLLMAALTVAGLLLMRLSGRGRELAVRVTLGASRGSLVRLLLLECVVLAGAAGAVGLALGYGGVALLRSAGEGRVPRLDEVTLSPRVFAVALIASGLASMCAGVWPAWRSTRSLYERLRARGLASDSGTGRALPALVVLQVAGAVTLVIGASLLVQTVRNLHQRALGFNPSNVLTIAPLWPSSGTSEARQGHLEEALTRLAGLPGVLRVGAGNAFPFSGQNSGNTFEIEGQGVPGDWLPDADFRVVTPGYFELLQVPVREGRAFGAVEDRTRPVAIVSETAAARFWPGRTPVGTRLKIGNSDWMTVVGVVGDARYAALDDPDSRVRPMLYVPPWQMPQIPLVLAARTSGAPGSVAGPARGALTADARLGLGRIVTLDSLLAEASAAQRFSMALVSAFAGTATLLASVGFYGLLALLVGRRTKEIGVRVALGAGPRGIVAILARRTATLAALGIVLGLAASTALGGAVRSALFGVSPDDPATYAAVALGFGVLATVVAALPAWRALRIDPLRALQAE
ncbi:MAG: ADOP family duplicated permease [Acidobacteriota bacterium]